MNLRVTTLIQRHKVGKMYVVTVHAKKAYGIVWFELHSFLIWALDGDAWSASNPYLLARGDSPVPF
jgi:hypothetical protein